MRQAARLAALAISTMTACAPALRPEMRFAERDPRPRRPARVALSVEAAPEAAAGLESSSERELRAADAAGIAASFATALAADLGANGPVEVADDAPARLRVTLDRLDVDPASGQGAWACLFFYYCLVGGPIGITDVATAATATLEDAAGRRVASVRLTGAHAVVSGFYYGHEMDFGEAGRQMARDLRGWLAGLPDETLAALGPDAPRPAVAPAAAGARRVAVLEFTGPLETDVLMTLSDEARGAVVGAGGRRFTVMSRETVAMMLADAGKTIDCAEGDCDIETARNIGADQVVTGRVARIDGSLVATFKLHDTRNGGLLASQRITGGTALELLDGTRAAVARLFDAAALPAN